MNVPSDRRSFLIAGSATLAAILVGGAYMQLTAADNVASQPDDGIEVASGSAISPPPGPIVPSPAPVAILQPDMVDPDTEVRLSRLTEGDRAESQRRMYERQAQSEPALSGSPADIQNLSLTPALAWGP